MGFAPTASLVLSQSGLLVAYDPVVGRERLALSASERLKFCGLLIAYLPSLATIPWQVGVTMGLSLLSEGSLDARIRYND